MTLYDNMKLKVSDVTGYDITYMEIKVANYCIFENGTRDKDRNIYECAGSWTSNKIVYIGDKNHLKKVLENYGGDIPVSIFEKHILCHELAHEVYKNHLTDVEKNEYIEKLEEYSTGYTDTVSPSKLDEEKYCEYIAEQCSGSGKYNKRNLAAESISGKKSILDW